MVALNQAKEKENLIDQYKNDRTINEHEQDAATQLQDSNKAIAQQEQSQKLEARFDVEEPKKA